MNFPRKFLLILFLLMLQLGLSAQSAWEFGRIIIPPSGASQWGTFLFNFPENPAFAGIGHQSVLRYQGEFPRFGLRQPHYRQTGYVDFPYKKWHSGWAAWWQYDRIPYAFTQRAGLQFSQKIPLRRIHRGLWRHHLRLGIGANVVQNRLLEVPPNWPQRPPGNINDENWGADLQLGLWHTWRGFYFGASASSLLKPKTVFREFPDSSDGWFTSRPAFRLVSGYHLKLPRRWAIHPFATVNFQAGQEDYRLALLVFHRYRYGFGLSLDENSYYAHAQLWLWRFRLGYAWGTDQDLTNPGFKGGTHQLNATFIFRR